MQIWSSHIQIYVGKLKIAIPIFPENILSIPMLVSLFTEQQGTGEQSAEMSLQASPSASHFHFEMQQTYLSIPFAMSKHFHVCRWG